MKTRVTFEEKLELSMALEELRRWRERLASSNPRTHVGSTNWDDYQRGIASQYEAAQRRLESAAAALVGQ